MPAVCVAVCSLTEPKTHTFSFIIRTGVIAVKEGWRNVGVSLCPLIHTEEGREGRKLGKEEKEARKEARQGRKGGKEGS